MVNGILEKVEEMEIKDLFSSLRKKWRILVFITVIAFFFFLFTAYQVSTIYEAEAVLLLNQDKSSAEGEIRYNKFKEQKDVLLTILHSRQLAKNVANMNDGETKKKKIKTVKRPFSVYSERNSNILKLTYKGYDKDFVINNLQNIIDEIDPTNEDLSVSSLKPLFIVVDEPYIKPVDLKKHRMNYITINTLAIFFTLIAIIFLVEYIKYEKSIYVKK